MSNIYRKIGAWLGRPKISGFINKINGMFDQIYTGYVSVGFKSFGDGIIIGRKAYFIHGKQFIELGDNVKIGSGVQLTAWNEFNKHPRITIGNFSNIGSGAHITSANEIVIGDHFLSGKHLLITDNSHGTIDFDSLQLPPVKRSIYSKGAVRIGTNVWAGDKVSIIGPVKIGDGVVIAANSVVTKDIPAYCLVAGAPARIIKQTK